MGKNMAERTNTTLEKYNRRFGQSFLNGHPNISAFVIVIRGEFEFYSERCKQVRENGESIRNQGGVFCNLAFLYSK
ncbi:hypothetical protein HZS_6387 [Henneguya salminicola]|nr:hypothetical protein HZS_6387 [Henneguya salminicola]